MLSVCRHKALPIKDYHRPDHPLQQAILDKIGDLIGRRIANCALATDGCNLPAIPMSLREMAMAAARFAARKGADLAQSLAMERVLDAMGQHPDHLSGKGQPTQAICEATGGRVVVKTGAEGFLTAWLRRDGIGIAIKTADGSERARFAIMVETLARLRLISPSEEDLLGPFRQVQEISLSGELVGVLKCRPDSFQALV